MQCLAVTNCLLSANTYSHVVVVSLVGVMHAEKAIKVGSVIGFVGHGGLVKCDITKALIWIFWMLGTSISCV